LLARSESDLQRREIFIDASSINKKYKDESDVEQTYTDEQYKTMLDAKGKQDIAPLVITETFNGTLDVTNGNYIYGRDFALGDVVTVQNNNIGKYRVIYLDYTYSNSNYQTKDRTSKTDEVLIVNY
jgi:hypothetical protein